jgi:hypothetical protein
MIPQRAFQVTVTQANMDQARELYEKTLRALETFEYPTCCPIALAVKPKLGRAFFSVGGNHLTVGSGARRRTFKINEVGQRLIVKFDSYPSKKHRLGGPKTVKFYPEN